MERELISTRRNPHIFSPNSGARATLSFRAVNRAGMPGYNPELQRHHLLPRQILSFRGFGTLFERLGRDRIGFDDFRANGLLLPSSELAARRMGMPLHRGPHRLYNEMVAERVARIESSWSAAGPRFPERALTDALMRLGLLQRALRRRLLDPIRKPLRLNRFDPLGLDRDFSELDQMAESLWSDLASVEGQTVE